MYKLTLTRALCLLICFAAFSGCNLENLEIEAIDMAQP